MGSVSIDTKKKERQFQQLTLSDKNVVRYLIEFRSKVDISHGASTNIDINQAGDVFELNQELIALYSSLDNIVEKCNFKENEIKLIKLLSQGSTIHDIINSKEYKRMTAYRTLNKVIKKIVKTNENEWKRQFD